MAKNVGFDGYAWGYSKSELTLFDKFELLKDYKTVALKFDPNSSNPFTALGTYVEDLLAENPYGMAGSFKPESAIYISKNIAPADLIELLAHEYGHVFHGEKADNVSWSSEDKLMLRKDNRVHSEAVAEAFSWFLLHELYSEFPEISFFHLAKLDLFSIL